MSNKSSNKNPWSWPTLAKPTLAKTRFGQTDFGQNRLWPKPSLTCCVWCVACLFVCVCVCLCECVCCVGGCWFHGFRYGVSCVGVGFKVLALVDSPRAQACTFQGPGASNTTKIPPREGRKNENCGGRGEKKREILGSPPFGPPPFGPPPFGPPTLLAPTFSGFGPLAYTPP